ncbi:hypothetical protein RJ639_018840 [Escallonia herrerae]|uniref:Phytocyanin domain-containing protein n=1 Tax=Escallonia herrerae TaxID=1293975 RepID=A0AA88V9J5_9ASTE|nr:hypothetical protein RJ639_018840 [Escallonia herrerae]
MLACAVLLVMLPEMKSTRFIVGSIMGWTSNVNYIVWARDKHFYVDDLLGRARSVLLIQVLIKLSDFVHDRNQMNVLEVNRTDYEACNSDHPIHDWTTRTGSDVVPLNVTRHYYFISGKGFRYGGMKLTVLVEDLPPPPSASELNEKSGSSRFTFRSQIITPALFAIAAVWDSFLLFLYPHGFQKSLLMRRP